MKPTCSACEISPRATQKPVRRPVAVDKAILKAGNHHGSTYYEHTGFRKAVLDGRGGSAVKISGVLKASTGAAIAGASVGAPVHPKR